MRTGSVFCICSPPSAVRHGLRRRLRPDALLSSAVTRRSSSANASCMTPATSANAEMSASSATAPAPGWANMTTPNAIESSPASTSQQRPSAAHGGRTRGRSRRCRRRSPTRRSRRAAPAPRGRARRRRRCRPRLRAGPRRRAKRVDRREREVERSGDRRETRDERERAEQRDQRGEADVRPDEDHGGEGDRQSAAQRRDLPDVGERPLAFLQMCFEGSCLSALLSVQLRRQFVGLLVRARSRAAVTRFLALCGGGAGGVARLREALVDGDPAAADLADRRLGLLARLPRLRGDAGLEPLEVGVPALEFRLDRRSEGRPVLGGVCGERVLGDVEPRLQLRERLLDLVGSLMSERSANGCLRLRLARRGDARSAARRPRARACSRSIRRRISASWSSIVDGAHSSLLLLFSDRRKARGRRCQRSARRGGVAASSAAGEREPARPRNRGRAVSPRLSASSASPSSAALAGLPASARKRLSRAWRGRRPATTRGPGGTAPRRRPHPRTPRSDASELDARMGRDPGRLERPRRSASACRWSSSASRRSPLASAIAPSAERANAAWSPNPMRLASSSARRYRLHRSGAVLPSLRHPGLEQQPRDAERVVARSRPNDGGPPPPWRRPWRRRRRAPRPSRG